MMEGSVGGGSGRGGRGGTGGSRGRGKGRGGRGKSGGGRGGGKDGGAQGGEGEGGGKPKINNAGRGGGGNSSSKDSSQGNKGGGVGNKNRRRNNSKGKGCKDAAPKEPRLSPEERQKQEEERKQAEAAEVERKRLESEQKALEVARQARAKSKEELSIKVKEASDFLQGIAESVALHKENRAVLAADSLAAFRKAFEASKKSLKSDLKKCTAFVKKIKGGTAWSMKPEDIEKDVRTLNLSRYVEEVVQAVLETKLKVPDLPVVIGLCKAMHQRYPAFLTNLVPGLWAVVSGKAPDETGKLRRIYVRIATEFLLNSITTETKPLVKLITEVTGGKDGNYAVTDVNVIVAFAKAAGFEILGVAPDAIERNIKIVEDEAAKLEAHEQELADKSEDERENDETVVVSSKLIADGEAYKIKVFDLLSERAVSDDISDVLLKHCKGGYKTLSTTLVATHGRLQKMEKRCEQDRLLSGSLTEAREKGLIDARKLKESLLKSVEVLSDILNQAMPRLKEEESDEAEGGGVGLELWTKSGGEDGAGFGPFDDEETRAFYCDIPDFLTTVPPALLDLSPEEIEKRKANNLVKYGSGFEVEADEGDTDSADVAGTSEEQLDAAEEEETKEAEEIIEESTEENKDTPHYKLMVLLEQELPECCRREQIDEIAEKFCTNHGSSKNSRKRLMQTLFLIPRTRLDLLPYYSRMAATLSRVWADISESLVTDLEQQFHGQAKYKKNQNIESRLKTARYIGELTKFRLAPPMVAFRCIRRCLDDFTGGNVDVACCALESCGRYLYRLKHTNTKLTALMEAMMRLSKAKHLDERHQALINTAFYTVKPPPSGPKKQAKVYPPLEGYLRHLLMFRLQPTESSIAFVSKQLIRFPWNDPSKQCGELICKIMMKTCRRGRYKTIQAVASVAAKLRRHKPEVCIRLLDLVLEELKWSIEHPAFKDQQRTLTVARLLGELYCASLASGQLIIQQLYEFLNYGHEIPAALREASEQATENTTAGPNSAVGVFQTIQEDEEMEDTELEQQEETPKEPDPVAVSQYSKFDPRVPTPLDPPNSVFRIKLVCTLFEAIAKSIVTRNNLTKIEGFLFAFQRYLFTKTILPTEVEFALLDTFDMIDSQWPKMTKEGKSKKNDGGSNSFGFPRFTTWLEAHNVTVGVEETEAIAEERAQTRLESLATDIKSNDGDDTVSSDLMNDEEDMLDGDDDDDSTEDPMSVSAKDSLADDHEYQLSGDEGGDGVEELDAERADEDEDDDEEDEEDSDDDEASEEEFDEEAYMQQLEKEAFERELRRLTMDALEKGKATSRGGRVADSMPMGSQVIRKKQPETENVPAFALGGKAGTSFQLLKKGNKGKMEAKHFFVPSDTNLAAVANKQDDKAARERDMIKARVLQYEAESAEAEVSGGNVYLEQEKLQVIRNRLSMEEIDRNFGTTGGNLRPNDKGKPGSSGGRGPMPGRVPTMLGRGGPSSGRMGQPSGRGFGRGRGRGSGRSSGGRSLV